MNLLKHQRSPYPRMYHYITSFRLNVNKPCFCHITPTDYKLTLIPSHLPGDNINAMITVWRMRQTRKLPYYHTHTTMYYALLRCPGTTTSHYKTLFMSESGNH